MRKIILLLIVMFPLLALAQATLTVVPTVTPTDFLQFLIQSINGMKGASVLAIVTIVVQILLKVLDLQFVEDFLGKSFGDWNGGWKLFTVMGLTIVGGFVGLMLPPTSLTIGAALMHSTTLSAFLVLGNQMYQHWVLKKPAVAPLK